MFNFIERYFRVYAGPWRWLNRSFSYYRPDHLDRSDCVALMITEKPAS
jgi:hypothetical protein